MEPASDKPVMAISELRGLVNIDGRFTYSDAEIIIAAYFRGLLRRSELARYAAIIYSHPSSVPDWFRYLLS